jgi:hypothetical protein
MLGSLMAAVKRAASTSITSGNGKDEIAGKAGVVIILALSLAGPLRQRE